MVKPITPTGIGSECRELPDFVFTAVNNLLRDKFLSRKQSNATLRQGEIIEAILQVAPDGTSRQDVFANSWLDFEDHYRDAGWEVRYDKPGYNESYEAFFVFTKKS